VTRIVRGGPPPSSARRTVLFIHGRGGAADDVLGLASAIALDDVAYVAPEADGRTWYPMSFLAPTEQNEPWLSASLQTVARVLDDLEAQRVSAERVALLGFSQGACLSLEFAARNARRYAAVIGFSGGLIGPAGTRREYAGRLAGTPVFLGCSDEDAHIPLARVHETAAVFRRLGAIVDERIYPGMPHTINRDEVDAAAQLLRQ
jgi:predicted esterase